jgi:hypothetical protein
LNQILTICLFRTKISENYVLHIDCVTYPTHYTSAPGLSYDAMLKYTGVELELLTDTDMLYMFMEGINNL